MFLKLPINLRLGKYGVRIYKADLWMFAAIALLIGVVGLITLDIQRVNSRQAEIDRLTSLASERQSRLEEQQGFANDRESGLIEEIDNLKSQVEELEDEVASLTYELDDRSSSVSVPSFSQVCGPLPSFADYASKKDTYNACIAGWYKKYLPSYTAWQLP